MGADIAGFICAVVLAALVVAWIAYCMFVRERHKSEYHQYDISDLQRRQCATGESADVNKSMTEVKEEKAGIRAGIFILPSRHKHNDEDYDKRPDYPESPAPRMVGTDRLIEILNDSVEVHNKEGIYEVDSGVPYQSEV
ncbi:uncharacterized protein LOC128677674 [Plodia interpunctella]|uniref:uncharacterized protein LOC128677674 n=1 Tax=Plodia interpunctella TaxID=58824 RepID=UPI0023687C2A|nr:uncharacterized protein LOC128677674 [Plodia interpunctella]